MEPYIPWESPREGSDSWNDIPVEERGIRVRNRGGVGYFETDSLFQFLVS